MYEDDDRIYMPEELLFSTGFNKDIGTCTVALTPIDFWEEEHCCADFLGGHNVDNESLIFAGVCPDELMESIFESEQNNEYLLKEQLLSAGFVFNDDFDRFMREESYEC